MEGTRFVEHSIGLAGSLVMFSSKVGEYSKEESPFCIYICILASKIFKMRRITVEVTDDSYIQLKEYRNNKGTSISFEANLLIESAIREKNRKKKSNGSEKTTTEQQ